jgi:hypothetical protein
VHDGYGVAVGRDVPVQPPAPPERLGEQVGAGARRHAVDPRVGAHEAAGLGVHDAAPERRVERVGQVLRRHPGHEVVPRHAVPVLQVVRRGVLAARRRLQRRGDARRRATLQAAHEGDGVLAGRGRVLAGGLLPPPPPRVAEDVHVRRPDGEPLRLAQVVQRPRLPPDRLNMPKHFMFHFSITAREKNNMQQIKLFFLCARRSGEIDHALSRLNVQFDR